MRREPASSAADLARTKSNDEVSSTPQDEQIIKEDNQTETEEREPAQPETQEEEPTQEETSPNNTDQQSTDDESNKN